MKLINPLLCIWLASQPFFWGPSSPGIGIPFLDQIRIDRILFLIIVIFFLFGAARRKIVLMPISKIEFFMIIFFIFAFASLLIGGANADIEDGKNKWLNALLNISIFPFVTYFIQKNIPYSKDSFKVILYTFCFLGCYLSITACFEHFSMERFVWPQAIMDPSQGTHFGRARGPFLESVAMGRILTICFSCFVIMCVETSGLIKAVFFIFIFITTAAVYYTETRGPWIGFGLVLISILAAKTKMRRYAITLVVIILIVAIAGVTKKFSMSNGTLFSERQNTVVERQISYATTYKIFLSTPIVGIGFGKFRDAWFKYFPGYTPMDFDGSHNTWLTMLCELGLIGSFFYFSIIFILMKKTFLTFRSLEKNHFFERNVVLLSLAISIMYVITGTFSDLRWSLLQNNVVFLFWGTVDAINRNTIENKDTLSNINSPVVLDEPG